jgi:hypothetical protein
VFQLTLGVLNFEGGFRGHSPVWSTTFEEAMLVDFCSELGFLGSLSRFMTCDLQPLPDGAALAMAHAHPETYKNTMQVGQKAQVATLGL